MLRREACCSTLTFVSRLFDPDVLARCSPEIAQQARLQLPARGCLAPANRLERAPAPVLPRCEFLLTGHASGMPAASIPGFGASAPMVQQNQCAVL